MIDSVYAGGNSAIANTGDCYERELFQAGHLLYSASGKSTVVKELFDRDRIKVIDPDAIKQSIPGYSPEIIDSAEGYRIHRKSKSMADAEFQAALADPNCLSFVLDGTGTNFAALIRKIRAATAARFKTTLIYVNCPLSEAIARNAKRERVVPENVLLDKADAIEIAFELVSREVDEVNVIDTSAANTPNGGKWD